MTLKYSHKVIHLLNKKYPAAILLLVHYDIYFNLVKKN